MPAFTLTGGAAAPVEDVWKLVFDPSRFPEWWSGVATVRADGPGAYTQWLEGYPDFPMPHALRSDRARGRVTVSCQVSDIDVTWQLSATGQATSVLVHVALPEHESHRESALRAMLSRSLDGLTALAESETTRLTESPAAPDPRPVSAASAGRRGRGLQRGHGGAPASRSRYGTACR